MLMGDLVLFEEFIRLSYLRHWEPIPRSIPLEISVSAGDWTKIQIVRVWVARQGSSHGFSKTRNEEFKV